MNSPFVIAVVDDDPDVRRSLDSLLRSAGVVCRGFASGADLLAADGSAFGCVVTDINMPGMTGLELQAEMACRGWRHRVILMTAYATAAMREQGLAAGAVAFLTKPIDPDQLLEAIGCASPRMPD
ncbi:response regulator transcription factor [Novosphingobium sp. JCM 18896]|uniref:response regulator transcription factor n=1 Tax=Novosphingobium sp. JCM 18896 TaxID=2989731 RepID=UPI0022218A84|nr:response regulator [Novosphingobium sp. JCM 18896]MCW1431770.1 response regulator [Novosphingobium sp. JCM 18896]